MSFSIYESENQWQSSSLLLILLISVGPWIWPLFKHLFYPFLLFFIMSFIIIYYINPFYNDLCSYEWILFILLYF